MWKYNLKWYVFGKGESKKKCAWMNKNFFLTDLILKRDAHRLFLLQQAKRIILFLCCLKPTWGSFNDVVVKVLKQYAQSVFYRSEIKAKRGHWDAPTKWKSRLEFLCTWIQHISGTAAGTQIAGCLHVGVLHLAPSHMYVYIHFFLPPDAESKHASVGLYSNIHT